MEKFLKIPVVSMSAQYGSQNHSTRRVKNSIVLFLDFQTPVGITSKTWRGRNGSGRQHIYFDIL